MNYSDNPKYFPIAEVRLDVRHLLAALAINCLGNSNPTGSTLDQLCRQIQLMTAPETYCLDNFNSSTAPEIDYLEDSN